MGDFSILLSKAQNIPAIRPSLTHQLFTTSKQNNTPIPLGMSGVKQQQKHEEVDARRAIETIQ